MIACSCKVCLANCVCRCTLLFADVFKSGVQVPINYITATVSERKANKSIRGMAGNKRLQIIEEMQCNEKTIASKLRYLQGTTPPPAPLVADAGRQPSEKAPLPVLQSSSDDDSDEHEVAACS